MAYVFYLNGVQLPVPPAKLTTKIKSGNKVVNLINEGDVNLLKLPGLTEISFDALIPSENYPMADSSVKADSFLRMLERLKTSRGSCRFIVSRDKPRGRNFGTNMAVSVEDYSIKEDAENLFDVIVSIKLKQYKPYGGVRVREVGKADGKTQVSTQKTRPAKTPEASVTAKEGDTMWNLAKQELGDGSKYGAMYELNRNKVANPNIVHAGQSIRVPVVTEGY